MCERYKRWYKKKYKYMDTIMWGVDNTKHANSKIGSRSGAKARKKSELQKKGCKKHYNGSRLFYRQGAKSREQNLFDNANKTQRDPRCSTMHQSPKSMSSGSMSGKGSVGRAGGGGSVLTTSAGGPEGSSGDTWRA